MKKVSLVESVRVLLPSGTKPQESARGVKKAKNGMNQASRAKM